jgi:4-alpha-glucanotransferase
MIPMQDVLGLGSQARMNRPGTLHRNWQWRLRSDQLTGTTADQLSALVDLYGR